jgi:hypothetical protein
MLKLLFSSAQDGNVSQYSIGLLSAFNEAGYESAFWNRTQKPVLDAFYEYRPTVLFLDSVRLLDRATVKAVAKYNAKLAVVLDPYNSSDLETFKPLLETAKDHLVPIVKAENLDDFKMWGDIIDRAIQVPYGLDIVNYKLGSKKENLECDITYVGGFDDDKKALLSKYVLFETYPIGARHIKIFGNKRWPAVQFLGFINAEDVANLYSSAVTTLYIPTNNHTVHEKFYQIIGCGGIPVMPKGLPSPISVDEVVTAYDINLSKVINFYKNKKQREDKVKQNLEYVSKRTYNERIKPLIEIL